MCLQEIKKRTTPKIKKIITKQMKWMKRSEKRKFYTGWAHASSNRKLFINCWSIHLTPVNDGCHRNVLNIIFNEYILQFVQRNEIMFMEFVHVDVNNCDRLFSFFLLEKQKTVKRFNNTLHKLLWFLFCLSAVLWLYLITTYYCY